MEIYKNHKKLTKQILALKQQGKTIAFVPTMGALHQGHLSLVELARKKADIVVVSIFVNKTQFAPHEDFDKYPRQHKKDIELLKDKADILFLPTDETLYPENFSTKISLGKIETIFEGSFRPDFISGVAIIVTKLLNISIPDIAIFGEKDYQQLTAIKKLVNELNINTKIIAGKTIREKDGLASSSRNVYLSKQEREKAALLYKNLKAIKKQILSGKKPEIIIKQAKISLIENGFNKIDYIDLVDAESFENQAKTKSKKLRLLAAAYLGKTRLIDNIAVNL